MRRVHIVDRSLISALAAVGLLMACGGGGGGGDGGGETPLPGPQPVAGSTMTMSCADGAGFECSGGSVLRTENGVGVTSSGVEVSGKSTVDQPTNALGLTLATGVVAELRVKKGTGGTISDVTLLLDRLGLSWDGTNERPPIVEVFLPTAGRSELQPDSKVVSTLPLPPTNDVVFYDYATKFANATQSHYANNRYFPRSNPPRDCTPAPCTVTKETDGVKLDKLGNWRVGTGREPDVVIADRLHSDGDVYAGDASEAGALLPGATGHGVVHPGTRGYRRITLRSYEFAHLGSWLTQDTVNINEWSGTGANEHNKNRRGLVAFGAVTDPAVVPSAGRATYEGIVYGLYTASATAEPAQFHGTARVAVNFVTRGVDIAFVDTRDSITGAVVPLDLITSSVIGAAGANVANYFSSNAERGALKGGLGGRFFGPVGTGSASPAPIELGGVIHLSDTAAGQTVIGGFLLRRL